MTNDKKELVQPILNTITNSDIKEFAMVLLEDMPDYIWHIGASSTGKYHPTYSLGEGGLMRHQIAVVRFLNFFFELEQYNSKLTTRQMDLMRVAGLLHDGRKSGSQQDYETSKYTRFNHPLLMADEIRKYDGKYLDHEEIEFIADVVSKHMGQWSEDRKSNVVLPKPSDRFSRMLHVADYLASRKCLTMDFTGYIEPKSTTINPEEYVLPFGKYSGQKLIDIYKAHPDYCDWMENNIHKRDVLSVLKMVKEKCKNED
jgi:hypothetical protein